MPDIETRSTGGSTSYGGPRRPINDFWKKEFGPKQNRNYASSMTKASSLSNSTIDIPMRSSCNRSSTIGSDFSLASSANCSPTESVDQSNSTVIITSESPNFSDSSKIFGPNSWMRFFAEKFLTAEKAGDPLRSWIYSLVSNSFQGTVKSTVWKTQKEKPFSLLGYPSELIQHLGVKSVKSGRFSVRSVVWRKKLAL